MEPFFVYGIKSDAISIAEFIGVAAKLMPKKKAPASFQKQTLISRIQFLPQQPDQQLIDILGGLAACYQFVPKGQQGRCQQPSLAGAEC